MIDTAGVGITLDKITVRCPKTVLISLGGIVQLLQGEELHTSLLSEKCSDPFWQSIRQRAEQHRTYSPSEFSGPIEVHARQLILEEVCGQALSFKDQIDLKTGEMSIRYLEELHQVMEIKAQGPTAALSAVIAIAAAMTAIISGGASMAAGAAVSATGVAAGGTAAGIISAMGYAGFIALSSQAAMALAQNKMHLGRAAQTLVQKDSLKAILISMAAAGVIAGLGQAFNIPVAAADASGLADHVQRQALQQGVQAALSLADGQKLDPQRIAVSVAAQSLGALGASKIGEYYTNQMVDGVTHKLLHMCMASGIGGLSAGLTGDDVGRQALSAGIGALAAETMHDIIKEDKDAVAQRVAQKAGERGIDLRDTVRTRPLILDEIRARLEVSKFGGAMAAFFAKQDVGAAYTAATTAVKNNSAPSLLSAAGEALSRLGAPSAPITGMSVVDQAQEAEEFVRDASDRAVDDSGYEPDTTKELRLRLRRAEAKYESVKDQGFLSRHGKAVEFFDARQAYDARVDFKQSIRAADRTSRQTARLVVDGTTGAIRYVRENPAEASGIAAAVCLTGGGAVVGGLAGVAMGVAGGGLGGLAANHYKVETAQDVLNVGASAATGAFAPARGIKALAAGMGVGAGIGAAGYATGSTPMMVDGAILGGASAFGLGRYFIPKARTMLGGHSFKAGALAAEEGQLSRLAANLDRHPVAPISHRMGQPANISLADAIEHRMQATGTGGRTLGPRMMAKDDSSLPRRFGGLGRSEGLGGPSASGAGLGRDVPRPSAPKSAVNPQGVAPTAKKVRFGEHQGEQPTRITDTNSHPSIPVGSKRSPLDSLFGKKGVHNVPTVINGREYGAHALDRMMQRCVPPSVVENAISNGQRAIGKEVGTTDFYDHINKIMVTVKEQTGRVVTVRFGRGKA